MDWSPSSIPEFCGRWNRQFGTSRTASGSKNILPPVMRHGVEERFVQERRWDVSPFSEGSDEFRHRVVTVVERNTGASPRGAPGDRVRHGGVINTYLGHILGLSETCSSGRRMLRSARSRARDERRVIHTLNEFHHLAAVDPALVTF